MHDIEIKYSEYICIYIPFLQFIDGTVEAAEDYCRNPYTSGADHPWCYTADDGSSWDYCAIPQCSMF